ncbi:glycoside hydrolase family 3 protein [Nesterenkonia sp. CF4.4]|uniref:glycoside hydrolase family 3 protein n=1 Tax=Nesterenkonia sp. CF4.4 TaxID=3373079 RepID=UPI003EE63C83
MTDITRETTTDGLVQDLSLRERAGLLFQPMLFPGDVENPEAPGIAGGPSLEELILDRGIRFFCLGAMPRADRVRESLEKVQRIVRSSAAQLPLVFSTDPRHSFIQNDGATHAANGVSQWPEPIGLGALDDTDTVEAFADIVRQDYLAMGVRMALHPQIDLATEPRWARQAQSFGADPGLTSRLVAAYIRGLQGETVGSTSVAATAKHFPGGGAQLDGEDPHFPYGREQVYPGGRFEDHLAPFRSAIKAGTAAIMPYYGMPVGLQWRGEPVESVGFAFNRTIITEMLREELGFQGVVLSDFGLVTDQHIAGRPFPARAWGVEHLDRHARVARLLNAGVDQLGGEKDADLVIELVERGLVSEERVTEAAGRVQKLQRSLTDDSVSAVRAPSGVLGAPEQITLGRRAQSQAMTVLSNTVTEQGPTLPLARPVAVHLDGLDPAAMPDHWTLATEASDAEVAIMRLSAPFEARDTYFLERGMEQGSLDFPPGAVDRVKELAKDVPVVLVVTLSRPAILTPITSVVSALVADYGADDRAVFAALTGAELPQGRLPFELPRSMEAVIASSPDVGSDSEDPLFPIGWRCSIWG